MPDLETPPTGRDSLLKLLVETSRLLEGRLDEQLRDTEGRVLRPAHYAVFRYLDPAGSRVTELAAAAGMTQQSMGELVTHLERHGYVERVRDTRDGRAKIVVPTGKGRAGLGRAGTLLAEIESALAHRIGEDRLGDLVDLLLELRRTLESD
ncbi:transcriptional regulator, MarR family [Amycolatopsis marina]|uniref:Transcriptional regulator, MarR family n=1 Tax=Amycolatopsis marina TaxID=490629 RepID=A0A1I0VCS7_9PSEU|nr:MarR family transcriptional regulator [Amycolatopsis marina]SFA74155.1 transcriptional regulator, MarR family [Amycolatopsis marina]